MAFESVAAQGITAKIAEMIAWSDLPFSFAESPGFMMLMEHLQPRYEVPSRHYFTEKALPALFKKTADKIRGLLVSVPYVSFTTDIWSSSVAPMSLLSLTAQWIDSSFALRRATLHVQEFRGSHTAERIQTAMENMLNNWAIDNTRVHVIVRDNAANMKKAMKDMMVPSVGCVAHSLQLCVHEGLLSQRSVTDTLANARKIVGHFKHSPLAYSRLEDIQMELNVDVRRLQQDVQTRWNSSLYMLQSLLQQQRALSVYAAERSLPATLTATHWELMTKTAEVLSPFEELTRDVSRESATAADVIPAITVLSRVLSREEADHGVKTMKRTLLEAVEKRFSDVETQPLYYIATLLDSRYKDGFFTKPVNLSLAKDHLIQEVAKAEERRGASAMPEDAAAEPLRKVKHSEAHSTVDITFLEILQERQSQGRSVSTTSAETQVHNYLSEQTIPKNSEPLHYWRDRAAQYPSVAAVAARYLSAPCSSVDSERLFSAVANVLDEKRNRLKPENVEMLVFIKKNINILQ
ncbi:zinc finger BED domain-containing protein 4-like [Odontesthes bonariensis]|uniref:zinc finger BED domain-containing protein 4-like n=1 Tax=Odontesthes bonariensis TaxID=219752 RepID=UPI003F586B89